jgi:hypothetical protein
MRLVPALSVNPHHDHCHVVVLLSAGGEIVDSGTEQFRQLFERNLTVREQDPINFRLVPEVTFTVARLDNAVRNDDQRIPRLEGGGRLVIAHRRQHGDRAIRFE